MACRQRVYNLLRKMCACIHTYIHTDREGGRERELKKARSGMQPLPDTGAQRSLGSMWFQTYERCKATGPS